MGAVAFGGQRRLHRGQFLGDGPQAAWAVRTMVDEHKVDVDREARHLLHE